MPQMSPYNWFMLNFFFIMIFIFYMTFFYFFYINKSIKSTFIKKSYKYYLKW